MVDEEEELPEEEATEEDLPEEEEEYDKFRDIKESSGIDNDDYDPGTFDGPVKDKSKDYEGINETIFDGNEDFDGINEASNVKEKNIIPVRGEGGGGGDAGGIVSDDLDVQMPRLPGDEGKFKSPFKSFKE